MRAASLLLVAAITAAATTAGGCGGMASKPRDKPEPVVARVLPPPVPRTEGAIYQSGQQMELFADLKARRVGDILTIKLNESTASS